MGQSIRFRNGNIINITLVRQELHRSASQLSGLAYGVARIRFLRSKEKMMQDIESHPVGKEIEKGALEDGSLVSGGNLYSFIGFISGTKPIKTLLRYIQKETKLLTSKQSALKTTKKITYSGPKLSYDFEVKYPSKEDIDSVSEADTPKWMLAMFGEGWTSQIEKPGGIINLDQYKYRYDHEGMTEKQIERLEKEMEKKSRSKGGLQRKHPIRSRITFPGIPYISVIVKNFLIYLEEGTIGLVARPRDLT